MTSPYRSPPPDPPPEERPSEERFRCCVCVARIDYARTIPARGDRPERVIPTTIAGCLWFQAWCRFFFCARCWGLGSARYFPGARALYDALLSVGAYPPDSMPPDIEAIIGEVREPDVKPKDGAEIALGCHHCPTCHDHEPRMCTAALCQKDEPS